MNASGSVTHCQLVAPEYSECCNFAALCVLAVAPFPFVRVGEEYTRSRWRVCVYAWMFAGGRVVGRAMTL